MTDINFIRKISNLNNYPIQPNQNLKENEKNKFKDLLQEKINEEVVFSKHANERIAERNIPLNSQVTEKLTEASQQAKDKGLKNVLVMIDNSAFIINTVHNKVITAVDSKNLKENIFTNIDGAVIK
ncbi:MAG TPA: hypothetical protein GX396_02550 [Tissierellia bacterium]|jgi:flagellar operon protein|nr:hypothetical protein [Tissierellia bacterium]